MIDFVLSEKHLRSNANSRGKWDYFELCNVRETRAALGSILYVVNTRYALGSNWYLMNGFGAWTHATLLM